MKMARSFEVVVVAVVIFVGVIPQDALAAQHVVGGSQGWDVSANFDSWASSQTFKVSDTLVFKYTGFHSVVELGSEKEYDKCDTSSAMDSMNGGTSVVKLDKPGYRYFTCGTLGHCGQGMKLKIKVLAPNETAPKSASSSVASSNPASASTSAAFVSSTCSSSLFMAIFMATGLLGMV